MLDKDMLDQMADRGWANMREMLDKEMPERKKRPLLWIWMLAGLVGIGIAGAFYLKGPAAEPAPKAMPQAGPEDRAKQALSDSAPMDQRMANAAAVEPQQAKPVQINAPKNALSAADPSPQRTRTPDETAGKTVTITNHEAFPAEPALTNTRITSVEDPVETGLPAMDPAVPQGLPGEGYAMEPVQPLLTGIPAAVSDANVFQPAAIPVKFHAWRFRVEAGGLLNSGTGLAGGSIAAAWQKPIGSGKWRLNLGLGFRRQAIPMSLARNYDLKASYAQADAGSIPVSNGQYSSLDSFTLNEATSVSASQYVLGIVAKTNARINAYYLDGYATVGRKFSTRWTIEGGARIGYLLTSNWKSLPNANEALQVANSRLLSASSSSSQISGKVLSALDAALLLGMRYAVSDRVDLGVQYQHGVNDLLLLDDVRLPNRALEVFAGYRF